MINLLCGITAVIVALLLSNVESIGDKETKIIIILGWMIALLFAKGDIT